MLINRPRLLIAVACALALSTRLSAQNHNSQRTAPVDTFSLAQALQYALDHYPSVKAAAEEVNAAVASVHVAKGTYLPRFDASWQTTRATANNIFGQLLPQSVIPAISGPVLPSSSASSVWGTATGGLFSWEPFDFGLRNATVREAEAGAARARAAAGLTRLGVQQAVGRAYLDVVSAQQAVVAVDADVHRRETLARSVHTLADNQLRPGAEASRADAEHAAAQTRAIQAHEALVIAETTLSQLLGFSAGTVAVIAPELLDDVAATPPPTDAAQHPLVQSSQAAVDLARAREGVLDRTDRPRLYLQSAIFARGSGANPDGRFDGGVDGLGLERVNWAAGLQIVFPNLFDLSILRARRAGAAASTLAERARYDEALLTVSSQRRTADAMVAAAQAIARNTPVQLAAAQQSEVQARARYEAGLASIIEVAEAQNLLVGAEYQTAIARVDVWRALLAQAVARGDVAAFVAHLPAAGGR